MSCLFFNLSRFNMPLTHAQRQKKYRERQLEKFGKKLVKEKESKKEKKEGSLIWTLNEKKAAKEKEQTKNSRIKIFSCYITPLQICNHSWKSC